MGIPKELREKIETTLRNNSNLRDKMLSGDVDAIREIGTISEQKISPEDIIESYENDTIEYLYKKAKQLVALKEIYLELRNEVDIDYHEER